MEETFTERRKAITSSTIEILEGAIFDWQRNASRALITRGFAEL